LNHSLLSTFYFFPIRYTIPNDVNFFKHIANLFKKLIQRSTTIFNIFSLESKLVKCSCSIFHKVEKMTMVNLNAYIFRSTLWNFMKFLPHVVDSKYYKILRLHVSKIVFFSKNLVVVLELAVLELFWWIRRHGTLWVKSVM